MLVSITIPGFLITHDRGFISSIKITGRLHKLESVAEIPRLSLSVLKPVYNCAHAIREATIIFK